MDATERAREWITSDVVQTLRSDIDSLAALLQRVEREARLDEAKWWEENALTPEQRQHGTAFRERIAELK